MVPPVNDNHRIDLIPDLRIDTVYIEFDDNLLYLESAKGQNNSPGLRNQIKSWVRNSVDAHFHSPRKVLLDLHNSVASLLEKNFDLGKYDCSIRLFKVLFFEQYMEVGLWLEFDEQDDVEFIRKTGRYNDEHIPNQEGLELIVDKTIVNSILYILYNLDMEVSIVDLLKPYGNVTDEYMIVSSKCF